MGGTLHTHRPHMTTCAIPKLTTGVLGDNLVFGKSCYSCVSTFSRFFCVALGISAAVIIIISSFLIFHSEVL